MNNEPIPSKVCELDNRDGENRQSLCAVVYTRLPAYRPLQPVKSERIGKGRGNQAQKPRDEQK